MQVVRTVSSSVDSQKCCIFDRVRVGYIHNLQRKLKTFSSAGMAPLCHVNPVDDL